MKKILLYSIAIMCTLSATAQGARNTATQNGCNRSAAGFGSNPGRVSFKTEKTWKIGKQEWSDVVIATNCQKETFSGGASGSFNADCRKNPQEGGGDLFSWCAVIRFQRQLCARGWSIPTRDDFIELQRTLDENRRRVAGRNAESPVRRFMWFGPTFEGFAVNANGEIINQGAYAYYWSQSEFGPDHGFHLSFNLSDDIFPQSNSNKGMGFTLRCIKHHPKAFPMQTPVMVEMPRD